MRKPASTVLLLSLALGGCNTIGGALGSLDPDRSREEAVVAAVAAPARPEAGVSAFCPDPIRELYMVMPESGGGVGRLTVTFNDGSELLLEGDFAAAELQGTRQRQFAGDRALMEKEFGPAVAALPAAPMIATLYFGFGATDLNQAAADNIKQIARQLQGAEGAEISITGHTDTVGTEDRNQSLSLSRAERVRDQLIQLGIPADQIVSVTGMGESDLRVQTADNVKEEKNRRVEVTVR